MLVSFPFQYFNKTVSNTFIQLEYSVEKPLNREPPVEELVKSFITKASTAYDRNHGYESVPLFSNPL